MEIPESYYGSLAKLYAGVYKKIIFCEGSQIFEVILEIQYPGLIK